MARIALPVMHLLWGAALAAQSESVLQAIDREALENSRIPALLQPLLDSIGPRLTGTPGMQAANDWALARYREWGIEARNEHYGSWPGWVRGITHVDLLEPRVRSLNASMLAWSAGTQGSQTGAVVIFPQLAGRAALEAWLPTARGKVLLLDPAEPTCRPIESWARWADSATVERVRDERVRIADAWQVRLRGSGLSGPELLEALDRAGVLAIFSSGWSEGWGTSQFHGASSTRIPFINLGCEDYGLLFRLAEKGQGPVVRVEAESRPLGRVPVYNTIATIPGQLRDEFVVLSAHFDSWDSASGATDNGTGSVVMMEAMRILKQVYPNPRRTIIAGHWNGEEQGINGSAAFAADHPEIVRGLQLLLNQDTGTGQVERINLEGLARAEGVLRGWMARMPEELVGGIVLDAPGVPSRGSSDHSSFSCHGAPAFMLYSRSWDYGPYTWHTDLDTFDKISVDQVRNNARLVAMLAYLASEDPQRFPRDRAVEAAPCRIPDRGRR